MATAWNIPFYLTGSMPRIAEYLSCLKQTEDYNEEKCEKHDLALDFKIDSFLVLVLICKRLDYISSLAVRCSQRNGMESEKNGQLGPKKANCQHFEFCLHQTMCIPRKT